MRYDLTFVPKAPGQSWEEALEAAEEAASEDAPDPPTWERIVAGARQILGEISTHETDRYFELDHEATGVQLSYYAGEAGITVPYWYAGADAAAVVDKIYQLGRVVEYVTGLAGFDPQVELPLAEA